MVTNGTMSEARLSKYTPLNSATAATGAKFAGWGKNLAIAAKAIKPRIISVRGLKGRRIRLVRMRRIPK